MSRIIRAIDEIADDYKEHAVRELINLLGGDSRSMTYMALQRAKHAIVLTTPGMVHNPQTVERSAAIWVDGWTAGALFATENPSVASSILDSELGEPQ